MKDKFNQVKLILSFLFLVSFSASWAQNLIPNASFEEGKCPHRFTRKPQEFQVENWLLPDLGTPDYYHRCAKKEVTVPFNWAGAQEPISGDAYVGIYLKNGNYHENMGVALSETLEKGVTYFGHFFIASVANARFFPKEISIMFSETPLHIVATSSFDFRQITVPYPSTDEFMDFSWQKLSFSYTARGNEKYLYVGSLVQKPEVGKKSKYRIKEEPMLKNASYVFLDDFYLGRAKNYEEPTPVFEFAAELSPMNVFFKFDEDVLLAETQLQLDSLAENLIAGEYHVLITGGTDSLGTVQYNAALGLKRAKSVQEYLIFKGVKPFKVGVKSAGENNPRYPNHSEESRGLNRTALIEFYREKRIP